MPGAKTFLATNVLLYLLSADAAKADRAEELVAGGGINPQSFFVTGMMRVVAKAQPLPLATFAFFAVKFSGRQIRRIHAEARSTQRFSD
jgi:predicted nucleic acid-binding protein